MATPQQTAQKWQARTKAAVPEYRQGIEDTDVDPMALAAANADKWLDRVQNSKQRFVAGLQRVSREEWKAKCLNVGANRIGAGVDAAAAGLVGFYAQLDEHQAKIDAKLRSMPDVTFEDSIARMTTQASMMRDFVRTR